MPKKRKGPPGWLYVIGVIVVVAALGVGAAVYFGLDSGGDPPPSQVDPSDDVDDDTFESVLISDEESGFGYMSMPQPWTPLTELPNFADDDFDGITGFDGVDGQAYWVEEGDDESDGWIGVFAVGALDVAEIEYTGHASIKNATLELAEHVDEEHWLDPTDPDRETFLDGVARESDPEESEEYLRVDGRRAYFVEYEVSWESDSIDESGATVILGIVDMGDSEAAAVMVDLPDSISGEHREHVDEALRTLRFD